MHDGMTRRKDGRTRRRWEEQTIVGKYILNMSLAH